jgi:hypothetical protein
MQTVNLSWLKSLEVFINVPDDQLQWFIDNSESQVFGDGEILFKPGHTSSWRGQFSSI